MVRRTRACVCACARAVGHVPEGLELTVHVQGDLTQEQRDHILYIAGKCPVKQMMLGKMPEGVVTTLAPL
eukprot:jgi/Mesen1/4491/ME000228S03447